MSHSTGTCPVCKDRARLTPKGRLSSHRRQGVAPTAASRCAGAGRWPAERPDGRGRHGNHPKGVDHRRYNNGTAVSSHGYLKIQVGKDHPLSDPCGYAYAHHLVWFSREADPPEDYRIHHIDLVKLNNRLGNLRQMTSSEHGTEHARLRGFKIRLLLGSEAPEDPEDPDGFRISDTDGGAP